jgi:hypothetical protein
MNKKTWEIIHEVNGGEYRAGVSIEADEVLHISSCTISADGVFIKFEERIVKISEGKV